MFEAYLNYVWRFFFDGVHLFQKPLGKRPKFRARFKAGRVKPGNAEKLRALADSIYADYHVKIKVRGWTDKAHVRKAFLDVFEKPGFMVDRETRMRVLSKVERLLAD